MTFEELLDSSASRLEAMSDEELLIFLSPCLKDCPPVDIQVVEKAKEQEALEKQNKKLQLKEEKKQQKLMECLNSGDLAGALEAANLDSVETPKKLTKLQKQKQQIDEMVRKMKEGLGK